MKNTSIGSPFGELTLWAEFEKLTGNPCNLQKDNQLGS